VGVERVIRRLNNMIHTTMTVRVPKDLYKRLRRLACTTQRSFEIAAIEALNAWVDRVNEHRLNQEEATCEQKYADTHIDTVDADFITSLYEYGIARNPKTGETIFCRTAGYREDGIELTEHRYTTMNITIEDVKEDLNEIDPGYFSFIGSDLQTELTRLSNGHLSGTILSMNQYDERYGE
jgi:predicted transcriptional regulator